MVKRSEHSSGVGVEAMLNALLCNEGDTVTFMAPDEDCTDPRVAIDCQGSWTRYQNRRFIAGTIRRCLVDALAAKAGS